MGDLPPLPPVIPSLPASGTQFSPASCSLQSMSTHPYATPCHACRSRLADSLTFRPRGGSATVPLVLHFRSCRASPPLPGTMTPVPAAAASPHRRTLHSLRSLRSLQSLRLLLPGRPTSSRPAMFHGLSSRFHYPAPVGAVISHRPWPPSRSFVAPGNPALLSLHSLSAHLRSENGSRTAGSLRLVSLDGFAIISRDPSPAVASSRPSAPSPVPGFLITKSILKPMPIISAMESYNHQTTRFSLLTPPFRQLAGQKDGFDAKKLFFVANKKKIFGGLEHQ